MITWNGFDQDGDRLFYELWYCPNEEESYLIAGDTAENSCKEDLSGMPGSADGYFYLYVTDGVNTSEAYSPSVKVPYKAPEILTVPDQPLEYKITEEIWLDTEIYDMQDGWLYGDEIVWYLDGRQFDTGAGLLIWPYELKPGLHSFTMTATNSEGLQSSQVYTIQILDDESDLPNDWSKTDVKQALAEGFTVNLKGIDAPITREKAAEMMYLLYAYMEAGDNMEALFEDYREEDISDCGTEDEVAWFAVKIGAMEAPNGKFNPFKLKTLHEYSCRETREVT